MTTHLCYTQDRVHTPYDYIFYRFLYQLAWIAKFSLCSPSALLHLPSYIFPLTSSALSLQTSDISHQPSYILHLPSYISRHQTSDIKHQPYSIPSRCRISSISAGVTTMGFFGKCFVLPVTR